MKMNARSGACAVLVALALFGGTAAYGADARTAYLDGAAAQGREDFPLAVERYKEALSLNPAYLEPMIGLAESFFSLEEYDEASSWAAMAQKFDHANPVVRLRGQRIDP